MADIGYSISEIVYLLQSLVMSFMPLIFFVALIGMVFMIIAVTVGKNKFMGMVGGIVGIGSGAVHKARHPKRHGSMRMLSAMIIFGLLFVSGLAMVNASPTAPATAITAGKISVGGVTTWYDKMPLPVKLYDATASGTCAVVEYDGTTYTVLANVTIDSAGNTIYLTVVLERPATTDGAQIQLHKTGATTAAGTMLGSCSGVFADPLYVDWIMSLLNSLLPVIIFLGIAISIAGAFSLHKKGYI